MKKKILPIIAACLMLCSQAGATISQDGEGYYLLGSEADWMEFVTLVSGGTTDAKAKLTANITLTTNASSFASTRMVGTSSNKYAGTFDGQGYTVTYNKGSLTEQTHGLFRFVNGAIIKNLNVAGSMSSSGIDLGGIVGNSSGVTIQNCHCSVNLEQTKTDGDLVAGGIIGRISGGTNTIENCLYDGTLSATSDTKSGLCGFVGICKNTSSCSISNCLFAGAISSTNTTNNRTVSRGDYTPTLNMVYYISSTNATAQGTQATAAKLLTGEIAFTLQGSQATQYWGQGNLNKSNVEAYPTLTSEATKKVVQVKINGMGTMPYVNPGGAAPNPCRFGKLAFKLNDGDSYTLETMPAEGGDFSYGSSGSTLKTTQGMYCITLKAAATTLVLPVNVSTLPSGITAYDITYTSGDAVTATPVDKITADKPVLINGTAGQTYKFTADAAFDGTYSGTTVTNGALTGVYVDANATSGYNPLAYVPADSYVLQNGAKGLGWYKVAADNTIKITSFRAYLTGPLLSRSFIGIDFDNGTTGISDAVKREEIKDNVYYDLSGRRVENPTKGLYIVNGKKVVIK